MQDFSFTDQVADRPGNLFDRHLGIDAVLVVEVDMVGTQPFQRAFDRPANLFRTTAERLPPLRVDPNAEFSGYDHLVANRRECLADQLLIGKRPVTLRRIEKGNTLFVSPADQGDHLVSVCRRTVAVAHTHATQSDGGHLQFSVSQFPVFHISYDLIRFVFSDNAKVGNG